MSQLTIILAINIYCIYTLAICHVYKVLHRFHNYTIRVDYHSTQVLESSISRYLKCNVHSIV